MPSAERPWNFVFSWYAATMATHPLIAKLAATKAEHRPILMQVSADAGMSPETRQQLVAHVLEEEDELIANLQAQSADAAPTRAWTVGPLRPRDVSL